MSDFANQHKKPKNELPRKPTGTLDAGTEDWEAIRNSFATGNHTPESIMAMQRKYGNQAVVQMMRKSRAQATQPAKYKAIPVNRRMIQRGPLKAFAKSQIFGSKGARTDIPQDQNLNSNRFASVDDIEVDSTDNIKLRGRFYTASNYYKTGDGSANANAIGKTVLFLSGSGGSAEKYSYDVAKSYAEHGADVLAANYRGFGASKKQYTNIWGNQKEKSVSPSEQGLYEDAQSMFNWLRNTKGVAPANVILHGFSLGGAVAANLAAWLAENGYNIAGMVMHSPMPNTEDPSKDAAEDIGAEIGLGRAKARKIGKWVASWAESPFDTSDAFQRLAQVRPDFPTFFLSGNYNAGDQLNLGHTGIVGSAQQQGLTNTTTKETGGDHEATSTHMLGAHQDLETWFATLNPQQVNQVDQVLEDNGVPDDAIVQQ